MVLWLKLRQGRDLHHEIRPLLPDLGERGIDLRVQKAIACYQIFALPGHFPGGRRIHYCRQMMSGASVAFATDPAVAQTI